MHADKSQDGVMVLVAQWVQDVIDAEIRQHGGTVNSAMRVVRIHAGVAAHGA